MTALYPKNDHERAPDFGGLVSDGVAMELTEASWG